MKLIAGGIIELLLILNFPFCVDAQQRVPTFTYNLGGMPISCSIYRNQASLNGIHVGDSVETVCEKMGQASFVAKRGGILEYTYKDDFKISFASFGTNESYVVFQMKTGWNSLTAATMDGVKVGMPETVLTQIYGVADNIDIRQSKAPKLSLEQNEKYQKRLDKTVYTYNSDECLSMSFIVKNGIIDGIEIYQSE